MELNIILGLKLKKYRTERDLSLKELSGISGLSPSYLNEIEKGKKYPKTDKILSLASALGVSYDELVSTQLSDDLTPLSSLLQGDFLDDLPLELFGIEEGNLVDIMSGAPSKFSSLIETLIEIGRNFDLKLEDFLFAALRAYQERHHNYFGELEMAVDRFRDIHGFGETPTMSLKDLETFLQKEYKYTIDDQKLSSFPNLKEFRSVFENGRSPVLYLNPLLLDAQRKFILAKEIGFNFMGLKKRPGTSTWLKVKSFDEVLNHFKASYFAGSLLMNRAVMVNDVKAFFSRDHFQPELLLDLMEKYGATPEMFQNRLSQLAQKHFGIDEVYFLRLYADIDQPTVHLSKELHLSGLHNPHRINKREHYCRRWVSTGVLEELRRKLQGKDFKQPVIKAQFSKYYNTDSIYFNLAIARPLQLRSNTMSCVTLGMRMNRSFEGLVAFRNDPALKEVTVNNTCERCGWMDCPDRAAEPVEFLKNSAEEIKKADLRKLYAS